MVGVEVVGVVAVGVGVGIPKRTNSSICNVVVQHVGLKTWDRRRRGIQQFTAIACRGYITIMVSSGRSLVGVRWLLVWGVFGGVLLVVVHMMLIWADLLHGAAEDPQLAEYIERIQRQLLSSSPWRSGPPGEDFFRFPQDEKISAHVASAASAFSRQQEQGEDGTREKDQDYRQWDRDSRRNVEDTLLAWVRASNGSIEGITLRRPEGGGTRGLFADPGPLQPNTTVLRIPRALVLTASQAANASSLGCIARLLRTRRHFPIGGDRVALAAFLMERMHLTRRSTGGNNASSSSASALAGRSSVLVLQDESQRGQEAAVGDAPAVVSASSSSPSGGAGGGGGSGGGCREPGGTIPPGFEFFLASLPSEADLAHFPTMLLAHGEWQRSCGLNGTNVDARAMALLKTYREEWHVLSTVARANQLLPPLPATHRSSLTLRRPDDDTKAADALHDDPFFDPFFRLFLYTRILVQTRGVKLGGLSGRALVPVLDMLNTAAPRNKDTGVGADPDSDDHEIAGAGTEAGEQKSGSSSTSTAGDGVSTKASSYY